MIVNSSSQSENGVADAKARLVVIVTGTCASPTTTIATYAYDAQGRRKEKTLSGASTVYVTDADNREVLEYNGSTGAVQAWYAYGIGSNAVVNRMDVTASTRQTLIPDSHGSIAATLDSSTGTTTKIGYQTYGEHPSLASGSFNYTAQRFDPETSGSADAGAAAVPSRWDSGYAVVSIMLVQKIRQASAEKSLPYNSRQL